MKPSRKLLSSVIFVTLTSHMVHAASDITISGGNDLDITSSTPFKDATNNGGASNLSVITLTGALGSSNVVVSTNTLAGPPNGSISVIDSVTWNTSNSLTLSADTNIAVGATINSIGGGALNLSSGGTVSFDADVFLSVPAPGLTVNSSGVTQTAGRKLLVDGQADFNAGGSAITLLSDNKFGSLKLAGGAVAVNEADATVLTGATATSLNLTSAGTITDAPNTTINVTGLANLNAGANAITLGDNPGDSTNFGSLNLKGGAVTIAEDSSSELAGVDATSLALNSNGAITDSGNVSVTGAATLNSNGGAITLGDNPGEATNFGTLNFKGGAVSISEDSNMDLTGSNTATSATLTSSGALSDATATSVDVSGLGSFSGSSVSLGGGTFNTGTLTFNSPGAVSVAEDSGMNITGVNTGGATLLTSTAEISDAGATSVNVGALTASGTSISLGGGTFNASTVNFNSTGPVAIAEDSNMDIVGSVTAGSAELSSTGVLSDAGATSVTVNGLGSFSGASISLGGGTFNTGSLKFNSGGSVVVSEDSSTNLSGASTAGSLNLNSTAGITDQSGSLAVGGAANITAGAGTSIVLDETAVSVGGNTVLTAGSGQDIVVNNSANNFTGTVSFVASSGTLANVNVTDTSAFDLQPLTVTNALTAISGGALTDSGNLSVGGMASLGGSTINIGGAAETTNFGSLKFNSTGAVGIQEDSSTLLSGTSTGATLALSSAAGITNDASANLTVTNNANFAGTSITLGTTPGDSMNFGSLTFNTAGAATVSEDSGMNIVGANQSGTTTLSSTSGISDAGATSVNTGALSVSGTSIDLGGGTFNASTLNFNSTGAVNIAEDSSTDIVGANTAASATLTSTAAVSDAGATSVDITGLGKFTGTSISLGGGTFNTGSLNFNSTGTVSVAEDSSTLLSGTSTAQSLTLSSTAGITNDATTHLSVTNNANLSGASISLGSVGGSTVDFGTLTFNSTGAVGIKENSSTALTGTSTAADLTLNSAGALTDGGNLSVTGLATLSGTSIVIGGSGQTTNFGSLNVNSVGNVDIQEDSDTSFVGANTASILTLTSSGISTFTAGSTLDAVALDLKTSGVVLKGNNLVDTIEVKLDSGTTLTLDGSDTIAKLTNTGGTIAGAGTLTATGGATLDGGTVSGNLLGDTTSTGAVDVSGTIGGGFLHVDSGLLTLTGTSTNTPVEISQNARLVDSNGGLDSAAVVANAGELEVNSTDSVKTYTQNGSGILSGTAALTATEGATLNGGTVSGHLLGDTTSTGEVRISGSIGGGSLSVASGILTLWGTSTNTPVDIASGASLIDKNGGLDSAADVTNSGLLDIGFHIPVMPVKPVIPVMPVMSAIPAIPVVPALSAIPAMPALPAIAEIPAVSAISALPAIPAASSGTVIISPGLPLISGDTVRTYTQNGSGTLSGESALTVTDGATLNGGTVSGHLWGDTTSTGEVLVSGSLDHGFLHVTAGNLTLTGKSTNTPVEISLGAALTDASGGLDSSAVVVNAGLLTVNSADTVKFYTQNGGTLAGSAPLTAATGAILNGGTVAGQLLGDTVSTGTVDVSGSVGGGFLSVTSGVLSLTGTSTNSLVQIAPGAALTDSSGGLDSSAAVENAGLLTVNSADTVLSYTQFGNGILAGGAALTAADGATLHGGTVSGQLLGDTTSTGAVLISGSVGGGTLTVSGGMLTLTGVSTSTPVDIFSGASLLDSSGGLDDSAEVTNAGLLTVNSADTVNTYTQNGGTLDGGDALTAASGAALNGGIIAGHLLGDTTSTGNVLVSGTVGGGSLGVVSGTLTLTGVSTNTPVSIFSGATLVDSNGGLDASAEVTNAGRLTVNSDDTVRTYAQSGPVIPAATLLSSVRFASPTTGGILDGSAALTATGGATLNGGKILGHLLADTTVTGDVLVSGTVGGGFVHVDSGTLTLTGALDSPTLVKGPGTLKGTGLVDGNLRNLGTLTVGSSGDKLTISGGLFTRGSVELTLENSGKFEQIKAGSANLGGDLVVTNTGSGLAVGETAQVIEAGSYSNGVENFTSVGFENGVLFNDRTGTLIGLGGGGVGSGGGYLNLSGNQTSTYIALFDDSVQPGVQNVTRVKNPTGPGYIINFTSGATNGDPQLVSALYQATFSTPGSIDADTMNSLSPEAHHGMVDYTEQALRSHVREAVDTAPVARKGRTQVFATLHTTSDGVDSTGTDAGYDLEMNGATAGVRYDVNKNFQIGGLLGLDDGSIKGPRIDTDAEGIVLGTFASYNFNDSHHTKLTGVAAYGSYSYDSTRRSFGGDATADGIGSDAVELSLGVSTVLYEKDGFRLSPSAALTYVGGSVDGFKEKGPGVPLAVGSQDINSVLFDVGFDISYQITRRLSVAGRLGYVSDLSDSDDSVTSSFAATGSAAVPFTVSAPGIDNQAATLGLGLYYDVNDNTRVGVTYHGEFRSGSESSQTFGIGVSYGF